MSLRFWAKKTRTWQKGILFGAGHGGSEAIILGLLVLFSYTSMLAIHSADFSTLVPADQLELAQQQVQAYWSISPNLSDCVHPCPCGYYGDSLKPCTCALVVVTKYQKRISGPMLDRIDIHIEVPRVDYEKLSGDRHGESSASIRSRVQAARDIQRNRFSKIESKHPIFCNADMRVGEIRQFCKLQDEGQGLMQAAISQLSLSACLSSHPFDKLRASLKLARTIADLRGAMKSNPHI